MREWSFERQPVGWRQPSTSAEVLGRPQMLPIRVAPLGTTPLFAYIQTTAVQSVNAIQANALYNIALSTT